MNANEALNFTVIFLSTYLVGMLIFCTVIAYTVRTEVKKILAKCDRIVQGGEPGDMMPPGGNQ